MCSRSFILYKSDSKYYFWNSKATETHKSIISNIILFIKYIKKRRRLTALVGSCHFLSVNKVPRAVYTAELQIYNGCEFFRFSSLLKNAELGIVTFLPLLQIHDGCECCRFSPLFQKDEFGIYRLYCYTANS